MILLCIISYPFGKILDKILGNELRDFNARDQLLGLLFQNQDDNIIEKDEKIIMEGALELKKISVKDIMTPIDNV
jgi:Mg2+/Co2+ transporter CorC